MFIIERFFTLSYSTGICIFCKQFEKLLLQPIELIKITVKQKDNESYNKRQIAKFKKKAMKRETIHAELLILIYQKGMKFPCKTKEKKSN